ncbi:MAG TPA: Gfo/Idh/MocA family oxidoreductase [Thermomicrobiales bacterium]|nr:Gfo/Idh/MocA family oxidoreductase [Thermomicrobiales bacterium]
MNMPLRAAIVGAGRIASTYDDEVVNKRPPEFFQGERRHPGLYTVHPVNHAEAYRTTPGYELVAVAGRGPERLRQFRDRWDVPAYDDTERMLADVRPDVVSVCVQSAAKADVTVRIARAGAGVRAIIVEKAMATSMAETDAMIAACDAAGIQLIVNHPYRFSPMVREARELIDAGEIGEIGTLSGWSRGGVIHGGTHTFDLLRFFGGDIVEISAWGEGGEEWADRGASAMVRYASGAVGLVSLERNAVAGFDIRGSTGVIELSTHVGDSWIIRIAPLDPEAKRAYPMVGTREPIGAAPHSRSTTQRLLEEVRDALLHDAPIISTGQDGAAALEAGIATLISARERQPVSLPLAANLRNISIPNR